MALTLPEPTHEGTATGRMLAIASFAVVVVVAIIAFQPVFASMVRTWTLTTAFNHGFLVPVASLAFFWLRRHELATIPLRSSWWPLIGFAGLAPLYVVAAAAGIMVVQQGLVIAMLICAFTAIFGWPIARAAAFPLGFLFLMVPAGDQLIFPMQQMTAAASVVLLRAIDVPVFHDGVVLLIPSGVYEVGEACAGLRFLIANVVIGIIFAFVIYKKNWKRLAFIALTPVVAMIANIIRAFGLVYIGHLTDSTHFLLEDHYVYGWVIFALTLLVSFWIGEKFADKVDNDAERVEPVPASADHWRLPVAAAALGAVLIAPAYAKTVMQPGAEPIVRVNGVSGPANWEEVAPPTNWAPEFQLTDAHVQRRFQRGEDIVDVVIPFYGSQRGDAEVAREDNRFHDNGFWSRTEFRELELPIPGMPPTVVAQRLVSDRGDTRIVLTWFWLDGTWLSNRASVLMWTAQQRIVGDFTPAAVLALSVPDTTEMDEAAAIVADFAGDGRVLTRLMEGFDVE